MIILYHGIPYYVYCIYYYINLLVIKQRKCKIIIIMYATTHAKITKIPCNALVPSPLSYKSKEKHSNVSKQEWNSEKVTLDSVDVIDVKGDDIIINIDWDDNELFTGSAAGSSTFKTIQMSLMERLMKEYSQRGPLYQMVSLQCCYKKQSKY